MKRIICAALSGILVLGLLAGCSEAGGEAGESTPMGRYIEEQTAVLEGISRVLDLHLDSDGRPVFYVLGEGTDGALRLERCVLPAGGGDLERTEQTWTGGLAGIRDISEASDGTAYVLASGAEGQNGIYRLRGGALEPVELPELGQDQAAGEGLAVQHAESEVTGTVAFCAGGRFLSGVRALDEGELLVIFGGEGISRYRSTDGHLLMEYPTQSYNSGAAVLGDTLLAVSADGKETVLYDLKTGRQTGGSIYDGLSFLTALGLDDEGVYLGDATGIYRQTAGGTIWEKLVDGELTSLSMPTLSLSGLTSDGEGGFYALLQGEDDVRLLHYSYDPDTPTLPDTELVIFGLRDSDTIRQAIGEFQRSNPTVRVNFQVLLDEELGATAEDVIRTLNTELMAGKGPDLLLLDGLNVDSYIEKGVLADMTEQTRRLEEDGLMPNLTNAYCRDGRVYGVPARFTVPVMMGEQECVEQVRSLTDLAGLVEEGQGGEPAFLCPSAQLFGETGMLMDYYDVCAGSIVTEKGVDQQALEGYFADMLRIQQAERENTPELGDGVSFALVVAASGGGSGAEILDPGSNRLSEGKALFHVQELAGQFSLENILTALNGREGGTPLVSYSTGGSGGNTGEKPARDWTLDTLFGGNAYTPSSGVGIVSTGNQRELAESFVDMLLSRTVQDSYLYDGFPVNGGSLDAMVEQAAENAEDDMGFRALCDRLDAPILSDQVVKEAVERQLRGLSDGSLTPEQAAANVMEKTRIYLAE